MKINDTLFICITSALLCAGCQNNDLSGENSALKERITTLEQQLLTLEQQNTPIYTIDELAVMVDAFVAAVGSSSPDINNSGNLDQFFSLKREADKIEHALENYENDLEAQYRNETLTRQSYTIKDKEIENLEEYLDNAADRLEVIFGIDD